MKEEIAVRWHRTEGDGMDYTSYVTHNAYIAKTKKETMFRFKSPTAERRRVVRRSWRGSNPRRPAPEEQGMPALTTRPLLALHTYYMTRKFRMALM